MLRVLALGVAAAWLGGCELLQTRPGAGAVAQEVPAYAEVARRYNERVAPLTDLWARATAVVEGVDAQGERLREQAEGHLQLQPPRHLAMSLGKVGETYLYLGSNDERYWWFDMVDADAKVGFVGRHEDVTDDKIRALGLPVEPLELVELLGVTPLPEGEGARGRVRAVEGGARWQIVTPARWGTREVRVDPKTMEPSWIRLLDQEGRPLALAELDRYDLVQGAPSPSPRVAGRLTVRTPRFRGDVRLSLYDHAVGRTRAVAFDLERLQRVYRLDEMKDLDAAEGGAAWGEVP